jgi:Peptidase C13 family
MAKLWCIPKIVLRAAIWKATPQPCAGNLLSLIVYSVALVAAGLVLEYFFAGEGVHFVAYGLNASIAFLALVLATAALFVRSEARVTFVSALTAFSALLSATISIFIAVHASSHLEFPDFMSWVSRHRTATFLVAQFVCCVWWVGAVCAIMRSVEPERRTGRIRRAIGLWLALMVAGLALPYQPTFRGANFDRRTSNLWEFIPAALKGHSPDSNVPAPRLVDSEQVELAQPALLEAQASYLAPRTAGKTNIYAIGIAGWSAQDVFVKELDGGIKSLSQVLPVDGHVIRLINRFDTVSNTPIASLQNFAAAVHAIARVMDRERDILLLFMTSHGSPDGVALLLEGELYADLSPRDVATVLDGEGITNRIVIVSACYSGVFLKPLANDDSIILTAADENHPSFGCSNEREWTYFGDALFNRSMLPGEDLEEAFLNAKAAVTQWEVSEGLTPSNPQGYFGRALTSKLASVYLHPTSTAPMKSAAGLERAATP